MRIVDLFSGAGGLTFGFKYRIEGNHFVDKKYNNIIFANECNEAASDAFRMNFPEIPLIMDDIRNLHDDRVRELIGETEIDVIIGGPPCQSYSLVGQRTYDDKASLYNEYYRLLSIIKPKIFLFENVKGMVSMKDKEGKPVIDDLQNKFKHISDNLGYNIHYEILDAANYGVPQHRERIFFIGVRSDLDARWEFPEKRGTTLTLQEAISDFPLVLPGEEINQYDREPINAYQALMRNGAVDLTCHFCALYGKKIQTVINNVPQGEGKDFINSLVDNGDLDEKFKLTSGYKNTYGRLFPNQPCTTITHNMSTPSGLRCIHYDYNRALTPREGARIQSFPDWFQFSGNKSNIKSQIGNAVPPLLAIELANAIEELID